MNNFDEKFVFKTYVKNYSDVISSSTHRFVSNEEMKKKEREESCEQV